MSLRLVNPMVPLVTLSLLGACGSDASPGAAPLRPGVEDSTHVYKGTPSAAESAFWYALHALRSLYSTPGRVCCSTRCAP